jgi:hypothetical protein
VLGVVAPTVVPSIVPPLMSAVSATSESMFAVPSMFRLRHSWPVTPRSNELSVEGTKSDATRALKLTVSELLLPSVLLSLTVRAVAVRLAIVPSDVSEDAVTPDARVAPVSVPAAAVTVMSALPLKLTPLISRAVSNVVAVPALPVIVVWSPVLVPLTAVVPVTESAGVLVPVTVTPLIEVAVAAPKVGVTRVGLLAKTSAPVPVSSVTAAARLAEDGVPRKVATPVPRLVSPVPPFATATGEVREKTVPVSVSPVPAVNVPAPLNCDHGRAVVPSVPPASAVQTKPASALTEPCSMKVNAEVSASHVFASVVRVHATAAQR